jgi:hypothetical protein
MDYGGFDVPRDTRSSNSAHLSARREACSIRRAAVERNSLSSARSSSDVRLVCATAQAALFNIGVEETESADESTTDGRIGE